MFKTSMALLGAAALLATPGTAFAQHLQSNSSSVTLQGPAALNAYRCMLTLNGNLTEKGVHSPNLYDSGNNLNGTNVPNPSAACAIITIQNGDFDVVSSVSGSNALLINNLQIMAGSPCNTGPFYAKVTNISATQVRVEVNAPSTGCGAIAADLLSNPANAVQLVP